jgi:formate hydrogenlyase subunit 3/multisubunit Na+/H+ antiporter MnhD subunit
VAAGAGGFALLAGAIPLHGWAPQAHAGASAPAAALFSTVVMKVGLFGMLTVSLAGGVPPLWWGVMLLVLGMITAFIGGLYADGAQHSAPWPITPWRISALSCWGWAPSSPAWLPATAR